MRCHQRLCLQASELAQAALDADTAKDEARHARAELAAMQASAAAAAAVRTAATPERGPPEPSTVGGWQVGAELPSMINQLRDLNDAVAGRAAAAAAETTAVAQSLASTTALLRTPLRHPGPQTVFEMATSDQLPLPCAAPPTLSPRRGWKAQHERRHKRILRAWRTLPSASPPPPFAGLTPPFTLQAGRDVADVAGLCSAGLPP